MGVSLNESDLFRIYFVEESKKAELQTFFRKKAIGSVENAGRFTYAILREGDGLGSAVTELEELYHSTGMAEFVGHFDEEQEEKFGLIRLKSGRRADVEQTGYLLEEGWASLEASMAILEAPDLELEKIGLSPQSIIDLKNLSPLEIHQYFSSCVRNWVKSLLTSF